VSHLPSARTKSAADPAAGAAAAASAVTAVKSLAETFATGQVNFGQAGALLDAGWGTREVVTEGFRRAPLVYACLDKIAGDIATPRYFAARVMTDDGDRPDGKTAEQWELLLNRRANPELGAWELRKRMALRLGVSAVVYVAALRNEPGDRTSAPKALLPLLSGRVEPVYAISKPTGRWDTNAREHRVELTDVRKRYAQSVPSGVFAYAHYLGDGTRAHVYEAADVAVARLPDPGSLTSVWGPVQAASAAVKTGRYLDTALAAILNNDGMATTIVSLDTDSDEDVRAFMDEYRSRAHDPERAGDPIGTKSGPGGVKLSRTGFSPSDLDITGSADYHDRQVLRAFRLSRALLGETSGETFSNAGEAVRHYIEWTLEQWLQAMFGAFEMLLPDGLTVVWDTAGIPALREDEDAVVKRNIPLLEAGAVTRNELRVAVGRDPVDDDPLFNEFLVKLPGRWATLSDATRPPTLPARLAPGATAGGEDTRTGDDGDASKSAPVTTTKADGGDEHPDTVGRLIGPLETALSAQLAAFFSRVGRRVSGRARDLGDPASFTPVDLLRAGEFSDELVADATGWLYEQVKAAADAAADAVGVPVDASSATFRDLAARQAADLPVVLDTVRDDIARVLADGLEEGHSVAKIARNMEDTVGNPERARRIAQTETVRAVNTSAYTTYGASGVVSQVRWRTAVDDVVRATHAALEGTVVTYGQRFPNGLLHPGDRTGPPSETVNCRCRLRAVRENSQETL